jgi:uncharacterized protein YndB with AHSA1/START domain
MRNGKLTLKFEVYIAAPCSAVWEALTNGSATSSTSTVAAAKVRSKREHQYPISEMANLSMVDDEIVEVKPQERLVTTFQAHWDEKVSKDKPSRVAWELTPRGESSKVTLVDDRFDSETATYKQSPDCWNIILSSLKTFLVTGKPLQLDQST